MSFWTVRDTVRSLGQIDEIRIGDITNSKRALKVGLTSRQIERTWTERLEQTGFTLVESDEAPKLSLLATAIAHPEIHDVRTYLCLLSLEQPVHIKRLEQDMMLPTYTDFTVGIEKSHVLGKVLETDMKRLIEKFTAPVQIAEAGG